MFQKDMNGFPKRMVKNLHQFLVNEWILNRCLKRVGGTFARKCKSHGASAAREIECRPHFLVPFGWTEPHHDVIRLQDCLKPRLLQRRQIERRQSSLPHNYGMNKFYGNMLCIRRTRPRAQCEQ